MLLHKARGMAYAHIDATNFRSHALDLAPDGTIWKNIKRYNHEKRIR